jgi:hypothetical protein
LAGDREEDSSVLRLAELRQYDGCKRAGRLQQACSREQS